MKIQVYAWDPKHDAHVQLKNMDAHKALSMVKGRKARYGKFDYKKVLILNSQVEWKK